MAALVLAVIALGLVSKVGRNVSEVRTSTIKPDEKQKLADVADKIESLEHRVDGFENRINEHVGRLEGYEAKLNENAAKLERANQKTDRNSTGLQQANDRIDTVIQDVENLQQFKIAVQSTRSRILDALGITQTQIPTEVSETTEQENSKPEELSTSAEEEQAEAKETKPSEEEGPTDFRRYHYPD
jgi:exonuclease VII small subunit